MATDLIRRVGEILHGYNMLSADTHLGVAVSGGADSVVLLHILHALSHLTPFALSVLHANHKLRGEESDGDEAFVRSLAASLQLPVVSIHAPVEPGNLEQQARRARHLFFERCRLEHGFDFIALGHTSSDQAETVLLRLFRGSGLAGLAAMKTITRDRLVRPLLSTSRQEVRDFAIASDFRWREDSSNTDFRFLRNRVRLETMPQLARDYNPALEKVLSRVALLAQDEERYWSARIRKLYAKSVRSTPFGLVIKVDRLQRLHIAQQRRLLRYCVGEIKKNLRSIDVSHIDGILKICSSHHGHDRLMVPGVDAIRSFSTLLLTIPETMQQARDYKVNVPLAVPVRLPFDAGTLLVEPCQAREHNYVNVKNAVGPSGKDVFLSDSVLKVLKAGEFLQVRNWEPGDKLHPAGVSGPVKIKSMFQESKVVLWERRHWPVLVAGGEILWARQFGASVKFSPAQGETSLLHVKFESMAGE